MSITQRYKRPLDILIAGFALIILSPVLCCVALLVRIRLGRPVLFTQVRPGLAGEPFELYKFRTMTSAKGADGRLLPDKQRLTPFGSWLRRTSLDELPELYNVLRGDMSLVGPRPLLLRYMPYYTSEERLRFSVKPGITGWAQINGRNTATWDERLSHDVWYVKNRSLRLDAMILAKTVSAVFKSTGVVVAPNDVMMSLDEERNIRSAD